MIDKSEKEAAEVPFVFFFFGQAFALFLVYYNNFYLGLSLGWMAIWFPVNATF